MEEQAHRDIHVPHEPEVDAAIHDQLVRESDEVAIEDVEDLPTYSTIASVAAPGATYAQAEAGAARTAINALISALTDNDVTTQALVESNNKILGVLRDAGLIPSDE